MEYVLIILVIMFAYPFVLLLIDRWKGTTYACKQFGWHNGNGGSKSFDGCSIHATCSKCGKEVMLDSQGNWF